MCRRRGRRPWGGLAVVVGVLILLALVLPTWFWWLVCAGLLIWGGIRLMGC